MAGPPEITNGLPAPALRRLTADQYRNVVADLFPELTLSLTVDLEAVDEVGHLEEVGASSATFSALEVERFETAAYDIAAQVLADPEARAALVPCAPTGVTDDVCSAEVIRTFGRRAWRRPLTDEELGRLVTLAATASATLGSFDEGIGFAVAAALQAPHFLYRVQLGDPLDVGGRLLTDHELAERLSFFLWNTLPDAELSAAADAGELSTESGLAAQVDRMLEDERAREGVATFFSDLYDLDQLDQLAKDPTIFPLISDEFGGAARTETLAVLTDVVFDTESPYPSLFTTRHTYVDRRLATLYRVAAPEMDGFGWVDLPADGGRHGLLGHASLLSLYAHSTASSVTRRGVFVREVLLCQDIPAPPGDVSTAIPEVSEDAVTMRDRVAQHLEDPNCSSCHQFTDPIGLGLENFDGLGGWRTLDNGAVIDATGDLDGVRFEDAWELGGAVARHPALNACLARNVLRYATGRQTDDTDLNRIDELGVAFEADGLRVRGLLAAVANSPGFRFLGDLE